MYSFYHYRIEGRYHVLLCDENGNCHGVHYKGYARKGMADRIGREQVEKGYCKTYKILDTEESDND